MHTPGDARLDQQSGTSPALVPCPECDLPAEATELFSLSSTDGPVDHVALSCLDGHHFRMAVDTLPAGAAGQLRAILAPQVGGFADSAWLQSAAGAGFSRLPGRLGSVGPAT